MKKLLFLCLSWLLFHTSGQAQDEMSFTWDLTTNSWTSQSPDLVVWESSFVTMESIKGGDYNVNESLGGGDKTYTKFPIGATIRFTPKTGVKLNSIEFVATTEEYRNILHTMIINSYYEKNDLIAEPGSGNWLIAHIRPTIEFPVNIQLGAPIRLTSVTLNYKPIPFTPTMTHVNDLYWSTMYLDYPVDIPSGVNAYYVTVEDNVARLNAIDGVIPANTGVILRSETVGPFQFNQTTNSATTDVSGNRLVGWISDRSISGQDATYYALNKKDDVVGFYVPKGGTTQEGTFTAKAYKAYLKLGHSESVKELSIVFDDAPDGIETIVEQTSSSQDSYNLQGMKVGEGYKGLMISNGRKVYRK